MDQGVTVNHLTPTNVKTNKKKTLFLWFQHSKLAPIWFWNSGYSRGQKSETRGLNPYECLIRLAYHEGITCLFYIWVLKLDLNVLLSLRFFQSYVIFLCKFTDLNSVMVLSLTEMFFIFIVP